MEGLKASMHLFQPKHFLFPFMAHAIGTFAGAFIAAKISKINKKRNAIIVGLLFLVGGASDIFLLPTPLWFAICDLIGAYLPMAYIAGKFAIKK